MIALTDNLPLRTTEVWNAYKTPVLLPHRYGRTSGEAVQYDEQRTLFVWADHSVEGIDTVFVGGQEVGNWVFKNFIDSTGKPVAGIQFDGPIDEGTTVLASGRGKRGVSGGLMTNPADIVLDVLNNLAGRGLDQDKLAKFKAVCAARNLVAAGSITSEQTVQGVVRSICSSFGAVFASDNPEVCTLLWATPDEPLVTIDSKYEVLAGAGVDQMFTKVVARYAYEDRTPTSTIVLKSENLKYIEEETDTFLDLFWVGNPFVAYTVANQLLLAGAQKSWIVEATAVQGDIRPGEAIRFNHPLLGVSQLSTVIGRAYDLVKNETDISFVVLVGEPSVSKVVSQASRIEISKYVSIAVETIGNERKLIIKDEAGNPIAGASVTLNGEVTRTSDGAGVVLFPAYLMPPGEHVLTVVSEGRPTFEFTVII